jgi:TM2 domain-containing membrane protein YozV
VNLEEESRWIGKLATCGLAAFLATLSGKVIFQLFDISGHFGEMNPFNSHFPFRIFRIFRTFGPLKGLDYFGSTWLSLFVPMLLIDWRRISSPQRPKRLSLGTALWLGLLGLISAEIFGSAAVITAAVLAGSSLVVQAISSFGVSTEQMPKIRVQPQQTTQKKSFNKSVVAGSIVPPYVRAGWLVVSLIAFGSGLFSLIVSGLEYHGDEYAIGVAGGVDCLILSLFCFVGIFRTRFNGWYRYIIKPAILLISLLTVITSSIFMGCVNLRGDEFVVALFLIIFPALLFFIIAVIPASVFVGSAPKPAAPSPPQAKPSADVSCYKRLWALLLAVVGLSGFPAGLHRFYAGKIGTGILWFFTGGLFYVGQIIDIILILTGQFKDRYGLPLVMWYDNEELNVKAAGKPPAGEYKAAAVKEQPAEKIQSPSAEDYKMKPEAYVPTTTVLYESFHPLAFLFSGIGFILTCVAILVGLAVGLHLPYFVAAGFPEPEISMELEKFFGYSSWPELVMRFGMIAMVILLLLAAVFVIIGRRHLGASHLIRAVLGLAGFVCAVMMFSDALSLSGHYSEEVVRMLNSRQIGPALDKLLRLSNTEAAIFAGIIFLASVVILAWPARRKQTALNPALNQGVV